MGMMQPQFDHLPERTGFEIFDPIDGVRVPVYADRDPPIEDASTEPFVFPVDVAVDIEVESLTFPFQTDLYVRDGTETIAAITEDGTVEIPAGEYSVQVAMAPVVTYLQIRGPATLDVTVENHETTVRFGDPLRVTVGVRSKHDAPAATVRATEDPRDLMRAISTFGSALKTRSPERSFPTLRGHVPLVERGSELVIPETLRNREHGGVRIEVPETMEAVLGVASLAAYLDATVVPGTDPAVVADGTHVPLEGDSVATGANRCLQHNFLLDCVVRTEGLYGIDLRERDALEARIEEGSSGHLEFDSLYELPLEERVAAYAAFDTEDTRSVLPGWHYTTDLAPEPVSIPYVSYVANELSLVRSPPQGEPVDPEPNRDVEEFFRTPAGAGGSDVSPPVIQPDPVDTYGHQWVADGYALGASNPTVDSFRRRLESESEVDWTITVRVVCNDDRMSEEAREDLYGLRDILEYDVEIRYDVQREDLRELLTEDVDFLHYIGHVDDDGLECPDGRLDLRTLRETGVESFLLNACRSLEQGSALVEAGSIGGLVTSTDIPNTVASKAGRTLARLMNQGFSLQAAVAVLRREMVSGVRYLVVGDGNVTLCQSGGGVFSEAVHDRDDGYGVTMDFYASDSMGGSVGSFVTSEPVFSGQKSLGFGRVGPLQVSTESLVEHLQDERSPVFYRDELRWSNELVESLR